MIKLQETNSAVAVAKPQNETGNRIGCYNKQADSRSGYVTVNELNVAVAE